MLFGFPVKGSFGGFCFVLLVLLFSFFVSGLAFYRCLWCPFLCGRLLDIVKYSDSSFSGTFFSFYVQIFLYDLTTTFFLSTLLDYLFGTAQIACLALYILFPCSRIVCNYMAG